MSISFMFSFVPFYMLLIAIILNFISGINSSNSSDGTCPTWMYRSNNSSECSCGVDLNKAILCNSSLREIKVRRCHMISFDTNHNETVAGYSFYSCVEQFHKHSYYINFYYSVPSNVSQLKLCDDLNRGGLFCGACKEGYSPLVYSYKLSCKKCSEKAIVNLLIFIAFGFIPPTFFYVFVLLFKFNANSPCLHGFVLIAQLLTQTFSTKILLEEFTDAPHYVLYSALILQTLYSLWNLNFFRAIGPDICLRISTLNALSLEYVLAFYPMLLIIFTYIAVELYSRGYRMMIFLWRPFQRCSRYFRKEWNIKTSLVDVFATFLLLSYNRLLDISFSLLMYATAYNPRGEAVGRYLYYDSSKEFFGKEHRPFGILAILVLFFCNLLPFLLLIFYPMKWFQKCLNCLQLSHVALHTFFDSFTGCYKDYTQHGTCDCRYFAAFFLLLRLANCLAVSNTYDGYYFIIIIIIIAIFSVIFISARPYTSKFAHHNNTTMIFLMMAIVFCCCCYGLKFTTVSRPQSTSSLLSFTFILVILPQIYVLCLAAKWVCSRISRYRLQYVQLSNCTMSGLHPHCIN